MQKLWIVVADAKQARVYGTSALEGEWWLVKALAPRPAAGLNAHEHRPGNSAHEGRYAAPFAPHTPPPDVEETHFADEIAKVLERGRVDHTYLRLYLVAPPHLLGLIRAGLSPTTLEMVRRSLDQELTHYPVDDVARRLIALP
jgi:protein required for attachment to host cells